ncbi:MAG: FecR domain-containing protein [Daejeonella sp.]
MATQVPEDLIAVINKYLEGTATPEEVEQVNRWYSSFNDEEVEVPSNSLAIKNEIDTRLKLRLQKVINRSFSPEAKVVPLRTTWLIKIAAAAAIIFIVSTGTYFFLQRSADIQLANKARPVKRDSVGFENKIVLTLQDGSKISLTDAAIGEVIRQHGFTLTKTADEQLIYNSLNSSGSKETAFTSNTIETPKGGRAQVTFPDGSRVRINASSSLHFPVRFSHNEFNIDLNGEAYFEVTPNKSRKFRVRSGMQITEVLGTRFNIRAYRDEPFISTTLLEGSIRIMDLRNNQSQVIRPGQQAILSKTLRVSDIEADDAIAWTEGYFRFNNADIKTVMRELERWYGISVSYEGQLTSQKFEGSIDKNLSLGQVLGILEKSEVHFKVNGKNVTVLP